MANNKPRVSVSQTDFVTLNVQASQGGMSAAKLAEKLGMSYPNLLQRRKKYIEAGIPLPALKDGRGGTAKINVASAQEMIAQLLGKPIEEIKAQGDDLIKAAMDNGKALVRKEDSVVENATINV